MLDPIWILKAVLRGDRFVIRDSASDRTVNNTNGSKGPATTAVHSVTDLALAEWSSSKLQQFDNGTRVCTTRAFAGCSFTLSFFLSDFFLVPAGGGAEEPTQSQRSTDQPLGQPNNH